MKYRSCDLSNEDKQIIDALLLELATELDLHYDDGDLHALAGSFSAVKKGIALLERLDFQVHRDVYALAARFNKSHQ